MENIPLTSEINIFTSQQYSFVQYWYSVKATGTRSSRSKPKFFMGFE
jgi:hypothetical protein